MLLFKIVARKKKVIAGLVMLVSIALVHPGHSLAYSNDRLIDDGVFLNSQSMTPNQIQNFLAAKGSALVNINVIEKSTTETLSYYPHYNQTVSAAQAIYDTGQVYGVNPQVILATLQKEQSLITDPDPADSQLRFAMGYGCPDSSGCSDAKAGLFYQVDNGAWALRQRYEQANHNNSWWRPNMSFPCSGSNTTYYSPGLYTGNVVSFFDDNNPPTKNPRAAYATFTIQSAATASLYCYTPHAYNNPQGLFGNPVFGTTGQYYSGSYNFVKSFEAWFGSTQFPQPTGGKLLYQTSTGKIYLVTDATRYYVPSWAMMTNFGLDAFPAMPSSDATIQQYTDGGTLTNLVYNASGGVFLVNNRTMYHLAPDMCTAWGLSCFDSSVVLALGNTFQEGYLKNGGELSSLAATGGVIYQMSGGQKQPVANPKTLSDLGLSTSPVLVASDVNSAQPLGPLLMTTPGVIQFASNSPLYYFDGANYYLVPDMNIYFDWALNAAPVLNAPASSYSSSAPVSTNLNSYINLSGTNYVIDQGRKISVPVAFGNPWPNTQFVSSAPAALLSSLPSSVLSKNIYTDSGVFVLSAGQKHYVSSTDDFKGLNILPATLSNLRSAKLQSVATGTDAFPDGKLIQTTSDGKIYVVNNHKLTYIPGPSIFAAYGYDWGKISPYSSSVTSDYPLDVNVLDSSVNPTGDVFVASGSVLYVLPAALAKDYGVINSRLTAISDQAIKKSSVPTLPRFLYNSDDGSIYYASGEAIHHVSSLASYRAYGGLNAPPATVTGHTLSLFTVAQPI